MDRAYPAIVLAPILGLAVYCLTQVGIARLRPRRNPYLSLAIGLVAGLVAAVVASGAAIARSARSAYTINLSWIRESEKQKLR